VEAENTIGRPHRPLTPPTGFDENADARSGSASEFGQFDEEVIPAAGASKNDSETKATDEQKALSENRTTRVDTNDHRH
jgi:hypothetical protein